MAKGSHLGELEELILLAVRRLGEQADGGSVRAALAEHASRKVSVSTIYVTLMRLEEKGYAHSWKGQPTAERGGKAKRKYEVTPEGREVLERARTVRNRMWEDAGTRAAHG
jgi:DNA-binding PadR family transcriptional regulator